MTTQRLTTVRTIGAIRRQVAAWRSDGLVVGLVPTMGALHEGHIALIRRSVKKADRTVVSIFVNPTQFGPSDDLAAYPRTWNSDLAACRREGVDLVFAPSTKTVYPEGFDTTARVGAIGDHWEGEARSGHFDGVATVVLKLFTIVKPDIAFFGQKDFQQVAVVRQMTADFNLPVRIVTAPTVRESDGLALSSRNVYLRSVARADAAAIYRAIARAANEIRSGVRTGASLRRRIQVQVERTGSFLVDYVGFCDPRTLKPRKQLTCPLVILIAATCIVKGPAYKRRFIDNILIR